MALWRAKAYHSVGKLGATSDLESSREYKELGSGHFVGNLAD